MTDSILEKQTQLKQLQDQCSSEEIELTKAKLQLDELTYQYYSKQIMLKE